MSKPSNQKQSKPRAKDSAKPARKPAAKKPAAKAPADRSAAVAATWQNPKVAAARAQRHHVRVAGHEYPSMRAAFEDLGLPMSKYIRFRRELVLNGKSLKFEGKKFTLVK